LVDDVVSSVESSEEKKRKREGEKDSVQHKQKEEFFQNIA
jgi:hypothetical protein